AVPVVLARRDPQHVALRDRALLVIIGNHARAFSHNQDLIAGVHVHLVARASAERDHTEVETLRFFGLDDQLPVHLRTFEERVCLDGLLGQRAELDNFHAATFSRPKVSAAVSAIMRPIASDDVAPGDGALRTWTMRLPCVLKTKSSTSAPSGPSACARTPDGPGNRSAM